MRWYDMVGLAGTALIVAAYFLQQSGRLRAEDVRFPLLNGLGAAAILVTLLGGFNLSVAVLEATWLAISLYGIARGLRARRRPAGQVRPPH